VSETSFPTIKRARGPLRNWKTIRTKLDELEATLFLNGPDSIRAKIKELLPEYSYTSSHEFKANREEGAVVAPVRSRIA